jgi:hypothetical protein
MATKTEREQVNPNDAPPGTTQIARTDPRMKLQPIDSSNFIVPETLESLLKEEGFQTQRHVKLTEGRYVRGIYKGMEAGELAARGDGEVPSVKWVYIQTAPQITIRLLGAYNMISQLATRNVKEGDEVVIARGSDYPLPNGFRCTDYYVLHKATGSGAQSQVVDVSPKS